MVNRLKTGVIGAGVFGAFHAGKHFASRCADLVGVHDTDAARARALADRFDCAPFSDCAALIDSVDAVTIAAPAQTNFRLARAALEAGRHVYVEKPLALTLREADHLIALAETRSLVLQVGHQERFILESLGALRTDVAPNRVEFSRCSVPSGRGEDVSVVFDLMIHDLDIARAVGFGKLARVSACGDAHETIATLSFEKSGVASFVASRRSETRRRVLTATYPDRVIEVDFLERRVTVNGQAIATGDAFADPLGVSVKAFFSAILDGDPTIVDGRAGRSALEWAILIENARAALNAVGQPDAARMIA